MRAVINLATARSFASCNQSPSCPKPLTVTFCLAKFRRQFVAIEALQIAGLSLGESDRAEKHTKKANRKIRHRRSLEAGVALQNFPARRNKFPVPDHRESVATTAERLRNLGAESARWAQFRRISLHFPCRSGKRQQRRVRTRLPPPPSSPRHQRR